MPFEIARETELYVNAKRNGKTSYLYVKRKKHKKRTAKDIILKLAERIKK